MIEVDLHVHSWRSYDGLMTPRILLRSARRAGLAGIAVVDHGTIQGGVETAAANRDASFLVVVGQEIATDLGDVVGLFLTRDIRAASAVEVIEEIHEQGGLAVLPHPFKHHPQWPHHALVALDAVESVNARVRHPYQTQAQEAIAVPYELTELGGSDAHFPWEIGRGRSLAPCRSGDMGGLREAVSEGTCVPVLCAASWAPTAILASKIVKRLRACV